MKKIKVKVIKEFPDRYTGTQRKVGETMEITDARYREIKRSGNYVEVVKPAAEVKKESK